MTQRLSDQHQLCQAGFLSLATAAALPSIPLCDNQPKRPQDHFQFLAPQRNEIENVHREDFSSKILSCCSGERIKSSMNLASGLDVDMAKKPICTFPLTDTHNIRGATGLDSQNIDFFDEFREFIEYYRVISKYKDESYESQFPLCIDTKTQKPGGLLQPSIGRRKFDSIESDLSVFVNSSGIFGKDQSLLDFDTLNSILLELENFQLINLDNLCRYEAALVLIFFSFFGRVEINGDAKIYLFVLSYRDKFLSDRGDASGKYRREIFREFKNLGLDPSDENQIGSVEVILKAIFQNDEAFKVKVLKDDGTECYVEPLTLLTSNTEDILTDLELSLNSTIIEMPQILSMDFTFKMTQSKFHMKSLKPFFKCTLCGQSEIGFDLIGIIAFCPKNKHFITYIKARNENWYLHGIDKDGNIFPKDFNVMKREISKLSFFAFYHRVQGDMMNKMNQDLLTSENSQKSRELSDVDDIVCKNEANPNLSVYKNFMLVSPAEDRCLSREDSFDIKEIKIASEFHKNSISASNENEWEKILAQLNHREPAFSQQSKQEMEAQDLLDKKMMQILGIDDSFGWIELDLRKETIAQIIIMLLITVISKKSRTNEELKT
jgi:hypothetical protein